MLAVSVLLLAALRPDPAEDAAHRADRLRTQQLNRQAKASAERRDAATGGARDAAYQAEVRRYEQARAAWRRQVEACEAGDWSACR